MEGVGGEIAWILLLPFGSSVASELDQVLVDSGRLSPLVVGNLDGVPTSSWSVERGASCSTELLMALVGLDLGRAGLESTRRCMSLVIECCIWFALVSFLLLFLSPLSRMGAA